MNILKDNDETWYYKTCIQEILPFGNKKINPNIINLSNADIDPNLKKLLHQLNIFLRKKILIMRTSLTVNIET